MWLSELAFPGDGAEAAIPHPVPAATGRLRSRTAGWRRSALVAAAVMGLLLAGCGSSHPSSAPAGPAFPSTPAGVQAQWFFQAAGRLPIPAAAIRAHFDAAWLAKLPPDTLDALLTGMGQLALVSVSAAAGTLPAALLIAGYGSSTDRNDNAPGQMDRNTLEAVANWLSPTGWPACAMTSWAAARLAGARMPRIPSRPGSGPTSRRPPPR
jgi:hypothetical protein